MDKIINQLSSTTITSRTSTLDIIDLLVKNRGIKDLKTFLSPPVPELSLDLKPALKIINKAIQTNKNILIYGDYDVDGITATAILWQALYKHTPRVTPFVPHREIDGYGIKASSFFRFQKEKGINFDLLITVDNGIVAKKELQIIKDTQAIDIIVTDHHLPDPDNPLPSDLCTVVHSTETSGSAVSWFLSKEIDPSADMGLAALGTVADCLPLVGVNRSLAVHGLQELRLNPSPGIKKLINIAGIRQDSLSVTDLGFTLGPRINAVGRLSDPTEALRLLCSQNQLQASRYAATLNTFNQDRQILQKDSLEKVEAGVESEAKLIFKADTEFNPGIIGLIAGRLTEKYYRPSVIIAIDKEVGKGSCRSIPELNIIEFLRKFSDLFIDLGGHAGAAGFSVKTENIPKLKKILISEAENELKNITLQPSILVDAVMELGAVNLKNIKAISSLSPFGMGNPEPMFLIKNLKVNSVKVIGSTGDHLKLKLSDPSDKKSQSLGIGIDAVAFKKGELSGQIHIGDTISVVANLSSNTWNNTTTPQLLIKEINIG